MATKDWSAQQYLKFEAERTRPSRDLLAQIPLKSPKRVVDLGCGPGNSTAVLLNQYPDAHLTGMDSSPDMIRKASATLPNIKFTVEDLNTYDPQEPVDVFFSNAVFQWIPWNERFEVVKRLIRLQPSGGVFAFQVPDNLTEPSHAAMQETAAEGPWAEALSNVGRDTFQSPTEIYDELKPLCSDVNVWHTHYYHSLENHEAVVEWVKGTGLRPYIDPLSPADKESFLKAYLGRSPAILSNSTTVSTMLLSWIHPHLAQSVDPIKGRKLQASKRIQRGEVLLLDPPYAIISTPTVVDPNPDTDTDAAESDSTHTAATPSLLCSNPHCNSSVPQNTGAACPNRCSTDVTWCNETCREADKPRHEFECSWLRYSKSLRSKWGEYNFGMLWLIVRLLARRHVEAQTETQTQTQTHIDNGDSDSHNEHENTNSTPNGTKTPSSTSASKFKSGWPAISSLCGTPETWSHAQTREWTVLVKKYLSKTSLPHSDLSNAEILGLICREEANSFGLYPRETGVYPPLSPPPPACPPSLSSESESPDIIGRGEQFGAAVYPRASIANHSCCPNIIHKPDKNGRMVFTAGRDIAEGEECCISYFDMTQYVELSERRGHLQSLFRFKCGCPRCIEEDVDVEKGNHEEMGWDGDGFLGFD
ncbi:S-adenosyl-L-methionine-dependent methyltransferase [Aspergillus pseudoustus]|uniref:S-adenosyl-L-methionine-dependent methyltransferase n=1 Tax=Aspergillus pseudoustus TaxID=1810923 RepID=A0ABR4J240_9EURO